MKPKARIRAGRLGVAKAVLASPACVLVALLSAAAYYLLFFGAVTYENKGLFIVTVPGYLIGALIATASALLAVSAFELIRSFQVASATSSDAVSVITSSCGLLIAGCGCYSPIIASALYAVGFGAIQVSGALSVLADYQSWIIVLLVAVNLALIHYQLGRVSRGIRLKA
jgi:hypothetical protein